MPHQAPRHPWIVIDTLSGEYLCERCKTRVKAPTERMSFGMLAGVMSGFREEHRLCKIPTRPLESAHPDLISLQDVAKRFNLTYNRTQYLVNCGVFGPITRGIQGKILLDPQHFPTIEELAAKAATRRKDW
jgi:hypothetical protein